MGEGGTTVSFLSFSLPLRRPPSVKEPNSRAGGGGDRRLREALLLLEQERLVTTVPHVGATVTWLSLPDYEQKLFILDALEQPALNLILERISPEELEGAERLIEFMTEAFQRGDEPDYLRHVLQMHSQLFAATRYPQLTELVNSTQQALRRYTRAFVHRYPENWRTELETARQRVAHLRKGDAPGAAAAVQRGHAALLQFARERVEAQDPDVMCYLDPASLRESSEETPKLNMVPNWSTTP